MIEFEMETASIWETDNGGMTTHITTFHYLPSTKQLLSHLYGMAAKVQVNCKREIIKFEMETDSIRELDNGGMATHIPTFHYLPQTKKVLQMCMARQHTSRKKTLCRMCPF
jgi:hypothetical protein